MGRVYNCNSILDYSNHFSVNWIGNTEIKVNMFQNSKLKELLVPCLWFGLTGNQLSNFLKKKKLKILKFGMTKKKII